MDNLKPFDPQDIDASLIRLVSLRTKHYALFPFVDATGASPEFRSVCLTIEQPSITAAELAELATLAKRRGTNALWFIQFSTPWLVAQAEAEGARQRSPVDKRNR